MAWINKRGELQISPHLTRNEISCNCGCGFGENQNDFSLQTAIIFERIRNAVSSYLGKDTPITVNRGCSCWEYHKKIYEKLRKEPTKLSCHISTQDRHEACAMDLQCPDGLSMDAFYSIVDSVVANLGGVGRYNSMVHFDTRGYKARWDNRS